MIKIDKNSKMEVQDNNYVLYYRAKNSEKPDAWVLGGYFPTFDTLLQDWVINAPAHTDEALTSLQQVAAIIQNAEKHIEKLIHNK